jgi:para-nitrobenzyl esterase
MSVIETTAGKVEGAIEEGVHVFRAIPFAAPPVGDLRFRPPQPVAGWTGTRAATEFGPQAAQSPSPLEAMFGGKPLPSSEDCLTLNVWTPAPDGARRPVMVWIHGGAFVTGTGATPWYSGTSFARTGDVVVVTINYRLGAFGFLHLDDIGGEAYGGSGNLGILDQVAALEWVRDNIEAFGGDPDNVTAFGESAGAMSVGTLLGLPAAKGLFTKAIPQSGAAHNAKARDEANDVTRNFFAEMGLEPSAAGVRQLQDAPVEAILDAQARFFLKYFASGLGFTPVVDGFVLPEQPIEAIGKGSAAGVHVLIGTNAEEMKLFQVMDPTLGTLDEAGLVQRTAAVIGDAGRAAELITAYKASRPGAAPAEVWGDLQSDHIFRIPAVRLSEYQSGIGNAVYAYLFTWATPAFGGRLGACHALEIPFVFNTLDAPGAAMFTGPADDSMRALAASMHEAWATFARTGRPAAAGLPEWPAYSSERRETMLLDADSKVTEDPGRADREAWAGLR